MKRLLFIFFVCLGFIAKAQVFTPMTAAGYQNKRTKTDSTNYIPTFPGFPTLRSTVAQKQAAIAADSTNKLFYWYDPKTETWNVLGSGSGSTINIFNDTTILICSGTNNCDTFITNVTANYVSIFNDSTLIVCNTSGACDTININPTTFGVSVVSFTKNAAGDSIILTLSDNTRLAVKDSVGVGISTINIITDSSISICNFNSCDTFITTVNPQLVTILNDSTLLVCDTTNTCDTLHIPRTQFIQNLFDTTNIYNQIQNVYNYFSDTSFTNQFFPRGDGVLLDTVIRITDSTLRFIYTDGTQVEDTFRIALTQENITNITNILNYIDSLRGNDTTFILSADNLQSGLKALYSTTDSLSGNDTLHLEFPHNNVAEDSVLTTDENGDLKMKLGGGGNDSAYINSYVTPDSLYQVFVRQNGSLDSFTYVSGHQPVTVTNLDASRPASINSTTQVLNIPNEVDTIYRTPGKDSIQFNISGRYHAIKDSTGGASPTGAALTKTDDTNVTATLTGSPTTALLNATNIALGWTGALSIARGGTNNGSLSVTNGNLFYGDGTKFVSLGIGTSRQKLGIVGGVPAWMDSTAVTTGGGQADSAYFWQLTGNTIASASDSNTYLGTKNNKSLRFKTNGVQRAIIDSVGRVIVLSPAGALGTQTQSFQVLGSTGMYSQGSGGVAYWFPSGAAAVRATTNNATVYIDAGLDLTGIMNFRATTFNFNTGISITNTLLNAPSQDINIAGAGGKGYKISGGYIIQSNTDSTIVRFNENTKSTKVGMYGLRYQINDNVSTPSTYTYDNTALLELNSTVRGLLPPRMTTTQKNAISSPAEGLIVYDLTLHKLYVYDGTTWQAAW